MLPRSNCSPSHCVYPVSFLLRSMGISSIGNTSFGQIVMPAHRDRYEAGTPLQFSTIRAFSCACVGEGLLHAGDDLLDLDCRQAARHAKGAVTGAAVHGTV